MKFIVEKSEIDMGETSIENIFIEDYMPVADGNFVKVYFYAYKNKDSEGADIGLDNNKIARNLGLTLSDVDRAWKYWESEGVIEKILYEDHSYDIKFKNLRKLYLSSIYGNAKPKVEKSREETLLDSISNNDRVRAMYANIDYYMRRQTTPNEKMEILSWISEYNTSPDIIELAFEYYTGTKKKASVNYIRAIIISYYDKRLTTLEEVEAEIEKSDFKYVRKNKILRRLGMQYRAVSEAEIDLINSWYDEHKLSEELIGAALDRTASIKNPSINYVNSILLKWKELGINSVDEIEEKDKKPEPKKVIKRTKFHNFEGESAQHTDDELNEIAKRLTVKRMTKVNDEK